VSESKKVNLKSKNITEETKQELKKLIRNSTAEFLIFTSQAGENSIEVRVENETVWLTQKFIAELFGVQRPAITKHLANIFESGELDENLVSSILEHTASDSKTYQTKYYNLDAIISVGYRVNSKRATQFRQWATNVLREFAIKGFVLDKKRLENGSFLAENRANRKIPMSMEDWAKRLDAFLEFDDREILKNSGKISAKVASDFALSEFEKYRVVQDRLYVSDFDKMVKELESKK
jgi:hypothetical protein